MLILLIILAEIGILFAAYWFAFVREPRPRKVKPSTWGNYSHAGHDCHMFLLRTKYGVQRAQIEERKRRKPHHDCELEVEQHTFSYQDNHVLLPTACPELMPTACPELLPTYDTVGRSVPSNVVSFHPDPDDSDQTTQQRSA